jgi:hypothetical protein
MPSLIAISDWGMLAESQSRLVNVTAAQRLRAVGFGIDKSKYGFLALGFELVAPGDNIDNIEGNDQRRGVAPRGGGDPTTLARHLKLAWQVRQGKGIPTCCRHPQRIKLPVWRTSGDGQVAIDAEIEGSTSKDAGQQLSVITQCHLAHRTPHGLTDALTGPLYLGEGLAFLSQA